MKDQARTYVEISRFVMSKIKELGEEDRRMNSQATLGRSSNAEVI